MPTKKTNYYVVLGLTTNATDEEIKAAYRKLALRWHPDRHVSGKEHAAQKFIDVNAAYHALMGSKENTHSSADSVSTAPSSYRNSPGAPRSESTTKGPRTSSRPSSSGSGARKRPSTSPFPQSGDQERSTANPQASRFQARSPHSQDGVHTPRTCSDEGGAGERRLAANGTKSNRGSRDHLRESKRWKSSSFSRFGTAPRNSHVGGPDTPRPVEEDAPFGPQPPQYPHNRQGVPYKVWPTNRPVIPPPTGRLHVSSRLRLADDFIQKLTGGFRSEKGWRNYVPRASDISPLVSPLRAMSSPKGLSKEWLFPLPLTLEDLYHGTSHRFLVNRELLGRQTEQVEICIHVPPGTRNGTRIVCTGAGHQRKDGTFQDLAFLIEDEPNQQFSRVRDDLYLDICVPWEDSLAEGGGRVCVKGLDGEDIPLALPYPIRNNATEGQVLIKGAGMPIRQGHSIVGRGDMIIRWQIVFSRPSRWQNFKRTWASSRRV